MITEKIYLYEDRDDVYVETYICDTSPEYARPTRPFMLVCPGGGYGFRSAREAEPIARYYMGNGFNAAVLYYTVKKADNCTTDKKSGLPMATLEVARAISLIRENAEKWHTDPDKIAVCGFSAGGHLAGSAGVFWDDERIQKAIGKTNNKPNAVVLGYPVVTALGPSHIPSFQNLLSKPDLTDEDKRSWSLEQNVKPTCPPTFIAHSINDKTVPVNNALVLADALHRNNVEFELHVLPFGGHGFSLAENEVYPNDTDYISRWIEWSVKWLKRVFNKE